MNAPSHQPGAWKPVTDIPCAWGDSPFWHAKEERLYWVDTSMRSLWRLHVPSGAIESWDLPQEPGCVAPCRSGNLLIAMRDGLYTSATWGDIPQALAKAPYDTSTTRFGSGVCDPWGRFWAGSVCQTGRNAALYCLHTRNRPHPELLTMEQGVQAVSGLAWSPDARTLYWGDPLHHRVETQALSQAGQWPPILGAPMPFAHWPASTPGGAAVDRMGRYWLTLRDRACVVCLDTQGQLVAEYATPALTPTALCFGGKDLCTLYLTTARQGQQNTELASHPGSGLVFSLRVDCPGLPINLYWD